MRNLCQKLDLGGGATHQYTAVFEGLNREFDLGVYNLNYDTAALQAMPGAYTGFNDKGIFEPTAVHTRRGWGFLYHLHGSVHHSLEGTFGNEIRWKDNLLDGYLDGHEGGVVPIFETSD